MQIFKRIWKSGDLIMLKIKEYLNLSYEEKQTFFQAKHAYYNYFSFAAVILAALTSLTYFISDCQLYGRFARETLICRFFILIPLAVYFFTYHKIHSYKAATIANYMMVLAIIWCTIWAIYHLEIRIHASEGFIIMNLIFLAISFSAPPLYGFIFHSLFIFSIIVSHTFNHYENFDIMLSLNLPCLFAITGAHIFMTFVYLDHYNVRKQLQSALMTDPLTQVYNRNIFSQIMRGDKLNITTNEHAAFCLLDIDLFKKVNDNHGHDIGDMVLKRIGEILSSNIRKGDLIIRFGGEEFLMIFYGCDAKAAETKADYLRTIIENDKEMAVPVTASIGVAQYNGNFYGTIKHADTALYEAKEAGRNKVMLYLGASCT